jgi:ABC-type transporter MlaC component
MSSIETHCLRLITEASVPGMASAIIRDGRLRQEYVKRYEDYIVIVYSTLLGHLSGASFTVLEIQPDEERVIVTSGITGINGAANISVDW